MFFWSCVLTWTNISMYVPKTFGLDRNCCQPIILKSYDIIPRSYIQVSRLVGFLRGGSDSSYGSHHLLWQKTITQCSDQEGRHVGVQKLNKNNVELLSKQSTQSLHRTQNQWLKHIRNIKAQISLAIINSETSNRTLISLSFRTPVCRPIRKSRQRTRILYWRETKSLKNIQCK